MAAWVVRCGRTGAKGRMDRFEANSIAAIGWKTDDLFRINSQEELKDELRRINPYSTNQQLGSWASIIYRFIKEIVAGDLILTPSTTSDEVLIGRCQGAYEYRPEWRDDESEHVRSVDWLKKVSRSELSGPFIKSIGRPQTVYNVNEHIDEILALLGEADPALWDAFISWAKLFYEWELFDERERDYKLEVAATLAAVQLDFRNRRPDWEDGLKKVLVSPSANNLTRWSVNDYFIKMYLPQKEEDLDTIWGMDSDASIAERVQRFQQVFPVSPGNKTSLASLLLMADGATQYPPYRYTPLRVAHRLTGHPTDPNDSPDTWERYEHALGFWDEFIRQASSRGLHVRDRLDAQSLVWCITHYDKENLPEDWSEEVKDALIAYRNGTATDIPPPPSINPWSQSNITTLAQDLLWQPHHLQEIIQDLQEKRQVIFYGPPGTGKTYVAREIAKQCLLNGGDFEIVQFHPSYSYEDFVQGFRPKLINGQPGFELTRGPLRRIADKARNNPDSTFILIIDELNRGNVAKVFGELYFLLEYRDEEVRLQYGGDGQGFSLPNNLWFICTMNTADRSIALMDAALRRRFYFAPFFPDESPIKGLLRRWLEREGHDTLAADLLDEANKKLERDMGIGPSYFMGSGQTLDETRVQRIWDRAVIPYIEEQFFGDADKLAEFKFGRLRRQLTRPTELAEASDQASMNDAPNTPSAPQNDDADANTC